MMPQSHEQWLSHRQEKIEWTIDRLKSESSMYTNLKTKFSCFSGRNVKRESTTRPSLANDGDEGDERTFKP